MKTKVTYPESYITKYALYPESCITKYTTYSESCITKYTTYTENQHLFRRMESLGRVSHMPPSITAARWVPPPQGKSLVAYVNFHEPESGGTCGRLT